jgi:thiol-disulfide isomerase/thioredoxin
MAGLRRKRGTLAAMNPAANAREDDDANAAAAPLLVACLCAQWCGSCRDYAPPFAAVAAEFGARVRTRWIDIEDEADLVGEIDVENFPTLLIARGPRVLFFGTVTPHAATLRRLVENALPPDAAAAAGASDPHSAALARALDEEAG